MPIIHPIDKGARLQKLYQKSREQDANLTAERTYQGNSWRFGHTMPIPRKSQIVSTSTISYVDQYNGPFMLGVTVANSIITVNLNVDQSRVYLGNTSIPYDPEHTDATIDLNATTTDFHYVRVIAFLYDETDQKIFDGLVPTAGHTLSVKWSYVVLTSREPTLTRGIWSRIIGFIRVDHMQKTYESFVQWWKGGDMYVEGRLG